MDFPADPVLIARGKYHTLSKQRYAQIKRAQDASTTAMSALHAVFTGLQKTPPTNLDQITVAQTCMQSMLDAREKIAALCTEMDALKKQAWGD